GVERRREEWRGREIQTAPGSPLPLIHLYHRGREGEREGEGGGREGGKEVEEGERERGKKSRGLRAAVCLGPARTEKWRGVVKDCVCVCVCESVCVCVHMCVCLFVYMYLYVCLHLYWFVSVCVSIRMCICVFVSVYIY